MTSNPRPNATEPSLQRSGAGILAASIAAAAIVGLLTLVQTAPADPHATASISAPRNDADARPLDAGVDWNRVERAAESPGTSVAAYEQ
jgi:hypothetical protein